MRRQLLFFWPIVQNEDDVTRVTLLAQQLCMLFLGISLVPGVAAIAFAPDAFTHGAGIASVSLTTVFYFMGAIAVRRGSLAAAFFVAFLAFAEVAQEHFFEGGADKLSVLVALLSLVLLRAIFLVHAVALPIPQTDTSQSLFPQRTTFGLPSVLTQTWPTVLWPRFQLVFWVSGVSLLLLALATDMLLG